MRNFNILAIIAVVLIGLSACSSAEDNMYLGSRDDIIINNQKVPRQASEEIMEAKIETVKQDVVMAAQQEAVTSVDVQPMDTTTMTAPAPQTVAVRTPVAPSGGDVPPNAKPGECYAKVLTPAVTQTKSERIQVSEEQKVLNRIIPAKYEIRTERVQVSEEKRVLNRIIPARYNIKTERVLIKQARQYWKAGHGPVTRVNEVTGEIMCLVEEPAQYKTIEKRVLVEPEKPEYKMVPAEFKAIEKRVLVEPEKPEYKLVPAQFETVSKTEVVQVESWEWRRILCETNMGSNSIIRIQQALRAKGYNIAVDGRMGHETLNALNAYQRKNALATRGITYETLESLGLRLIGA